MTILCEPDGLAAARLLPSLDGVVQTVASLPDAAMMIASSPDEGLIVIGRHVPLDDVVQFAHQVRAEQSEIAIILLRDDVGGAGVALSAGVHEVVPAGDVVVLKDACRRAQTALLVPAGEDVTHFSEPTYTTPPTEEPVGKAGQIITVFSPKGGTGKTTIATNLAVALNGDGSTRVCLLDLDLEFGDVAITLRLTPARTLVDAVTTDVLGDENDAVAALLTEYRPGLDCILAPIEPGDAEKIPPALVADLLDRLRYRYDYVVVDTPSRFSEHVLAALDASQHHVLLTNPEIPALKNLRLALDMLDLLDYRRDARSIVINRDDSAAGLSVDEVQEALKAPIAVHVPASRDVPASINKGVPLVAARPDHAVSVAILKFATQSIRDEPHGTARRSRRQVRHLRRRTK